MDTQRKAGNELLAISHNANLSDGWMYPTDVDSYGRPIDAAWASSRDRNERLVEITQIKGQSETHPLLSPTDEFANYELLVALIGLPPDSGRVDHITGSYARQALKDGITLQDVRGYNPYKFGMAGASDSHNSASRLPPGQFLRWARGDRWHGRKDVWLGMMCGHHRCTPGEQRWTDRRVGRGEHPRLHLGRDVSQGNLRRQRPAHQGAPVRRLGLQQGHPERQGLGASVLCQRRAHGRGSAFDAGERGAAPTFVVWAVKDPTSGNLDRVQVIKGWSQNGQSFEKIYDVVWAGDRRPDPATGRVPAIQSTVDLEKATYTNSVGATELKTVWTDPEFDASLHAFYYARVLEIPTPRWTLIQSVKAGVPPPDDGAAHRTGARLDLADLVYAERRGAQGRARRHDRRGPAEEGRHRARRCAAEGAHRGQGLLGAQHGHRGAVQRELHHRGSDGDLSRGQEYHAAQRHG